MYNRYLKLRFLEGLIENYTMKLKKAAPRFELGIKDLQSSALPLGHAANKNIFDSPTDPNSIKTKTLLIISNGHGEDIIALEIIKKLLKKKEFMNIEVMPLVGDGYVFDTLKVKNFKKIGFLKVLPSGGFSNQSLKAFFQDFLAGMLVNVIKNFLVLRGKSKNYCKILAIGDLLPLFFAWSSQSEFIFIGTPKSDYTWNSGPGWSFSDFYHKLKGSEWDPWEIYIMRSSKCKAVIMRDDLTAQNLIKKKIDAIYLGNPMMDFVEEKNKYISNIIIFHRIILLIGSRFPEAFNNLDAFLSCINKIDISQELCILLPLSLNAKISEIENFLKSHSFLRNKKQFLIGENSVWKKNNKYILLGKGTFNSWACMADLGLSNAGTATEQIAGLGIPSLSFPGKGPQFNRSFAIRQSRMLGGSVLICKNQEILIKNLNHLLESKKTRMVQSKQGIERMGKKGASERIVNFINLKLLK